MTRTFPSLLRAIGTLVLTMLSGSSVLSAQLRDRVPPTAPTNLVVTATTEHSVSLAWGPSTDNSGRFSYIICCAGTTVTVSQTMTSHTLEGLQSGKTYTFRVYAKDAAGNLSKSSNPVTVTLPGAARCADEACRRSAGCWPDACLAELVVHRRWVVHLVHHLHRRGARLDVEFEVRRRLLAPPFWCPRVVLRWIKRRRTRSPFMRATLTGTCRPSATPFS